MVPVNVRRDSFFKEVKRSESLELGEFIHALDDEDLDLWNAGKECQGVDRIVRQGRD